MCIPRSKPLQQPFLVPPSNFACIDRGIYRSSFPKKKNFAFLKRLGLKTIIFLCPEEYPAANLEFMESIGARLLTFGVEGNKARALVDLCALSLPYRSRNEKAI